MKIVRDLAGTFTGVAEGVFYAANLRNGIVIDGNDTVCASRQARQRPYKKIGLASLPS